MWLKLSDSQPSIDIDLVTQIQTYLRLFHIQSPKPDFAACPFPEPFPV